MAGEKTSILLSDVSIEGDLVEKDKITIDAKINGDIKAETVETHPIFLLASHIRKQETQCEDETICRRIQVPKKS